MYDYDHTMTSGRTRTKLKTQNPPRVVRITLYLVVKIEINGMTGRPAHDWVGGNERSVLSTALDILFHYYEVLQKVLIQLFSEPRGLKDSVRLEMKSSSE